METMLVLLALVATISAGPIALDSDQCAITCNAWGKFRYAPGTTYTYDYSVDTVTGMAGASETMAKLSLQATAEIEVLSQCEFALRVLNTQLFHSEENGRTKAADGARQFREGLENSVVRFSFQDGVIDHMCLMAEEEPWSLNIKRGILSAFQNSMDSWEVNQNVTETDVAGECKTEYQLVSKGYYTTTVKKIKDAHTCFKRHDFEAMYHLVPYRIDSDVQSLPIMKTNHECQQDIENKGLLKSTTCTETHVYRPFSNGQSGGSTTIQQSLKYKGERRGIRTRQSSITSTSALTFDHSVKKMNPRAARRNVEKILRTICQTTRHEIQRETPQIFSDLISGLRSLDSSDLEGLHRQLKTKAFCPSNDKTFKMFLDALPMTATEASVKLMATLMINEDVTGIQAKAWLSSLAFITSPNGEMMREVKPLLESDKTRGDALLPVSSFINNYCEKMESCAEDYNVAILMSVLQDSLGYECDASEDKLQNILLTLRALGNAGRATQSVSQINRCLSSSSTSLEVKVAAAEAFRRIPCDSVDRSYLWDTFSDQTADSELRIAAYLGLMHCPEKATLLRMSNMLENEDNQQLVVFVYSHLQNIKESSNPHKQDLGKVIKELQLEKSSDLSIFKSSQNFEASMLLNKINTGYTAESNLIWSSESQLPRSFSTNLTFELFGDSINLLDFGGRLEGLEYLIRSAFGSDLPKDKGKKTMISQELDKIKASMYGRMFGNEMLYHHSQGLTSPMSKLPKSSLEILIELSKQHEYSFTHSHQILDVRMTIPSCAGLPLYVTVNGTASVDLKLSGKMDLRKVASKPRSLNIDGEIRPSGAAEITGSLAVDAFVTRTGLRMRNTMYTSTAMKGRVQLERGQQLNLEIDTPQEKIELFDARSKFFIIHNDIEEEQEMIKQNRKELKLCSGNSLATVTGIELCGEVQFPNASMQAEGPYFPLTGPSSVHLTLHKRDAHLGYKMFAKRVENKKTSIAQVLFNTPGSKVNRAMSIDVVMNYPQQELEVALATPWKKAALKGAVMNTKAMHSVTGSLIIDEMDTYALTAEVKKTHSKNKINLSPMFELRRPGTDNVQLTGSVSMEKPMKYLVVDLSLSGLDKMPSTIKGNFANTNKAKNLAVIFSPDTKEEYSFKLLNQLTPVGKKGMVVNSQLEMTTPVRKLVSGDGKVDYRADKGLKMQSTVEIYKLLKKSSMIMNLMKTVKKNGVRYNSDIRLKLPQISGKVTGQCFLKKSGLMATKLIMDYNIPKRAKNRIMMSTKLNDRSTKAYKKYTVKSNVDFKKNPEYNMGMTLGLDHKNKLSEVDLELKYGPNPKDKKKRMHFNAVVKKNIKSYKNAQLNYKITAEAPEHEIDMTLNGKHQHTPKIIDSNAQLNYAKGKNIKADVFIKDRSSKLKAVNGRMTLAWPGREYMLSSNLAQKSAKQYTHVISLKDNRGMRHDVSTEYKMVKGKTHTFRTVLKLDKRKPVTVSGSALLNPRNFEVSGSAQSGKEKYGFSTKGKIAAKLSGAKVNVELFEPQRKVAVLVDGGLDKTKMDGKVEVDWDAGRKTKSKLALEGSFVNKQTSVMMVIGGHVGFTSPFDNFENLGVSFKCSDDKNQNDVSSKVSWGSKAQELSGSLNVKKPLSLYNVQMLMKMRTPFRGLRTVDAEISHKMDSSLAAVLKGTADKKNMQLSLTGENLADTRGYQRDFKANLVLKSTIKNAELVTIAVAHADNSQKFMNNWVLTHNGQTYSYDMSMDHSWYGWNVQNDGSITVTTPQRKITTIWQHMNNDQNIKSTLTSKWDNDQLDIGITGTHKMGQDRMLDGTMTIQSPWKRARDLVITFSQKIGSGVISSTAVVKERGQVVTSSEINYKKVSYGTDFHMKLVTPYSEDLTTKMSAKYEFFPYTSYAEIQWAPKKQATVTGSLSAEAWDDLDLNIKVTTPVSGFRNVLFRAANKREVNDIISQVNLDYGVRKYIEIESHLQTTLKLMQFKLSTPFPELTSVKTGYTFTGTSASHDTQAHFELLPYVGKLEGSLAFHNTNDLNTKLRIETTFKDYPYFEISASSKDTGSVRQSNIRAEFDPQQVFSIDSSYRLDLPFALEAKIQSPYPQFNDLSLAFHHEHAFQMIKTHGEIVYQPNKKVEGDFVADWAKDVEGRLIIKTPFRAYKSNKISVRHRGDLSSFNSDGQIEIGDHTMKGTIGYSSGYTTTASLSITSSIRGLEKVIASLRKSGNWNSMRSNAKLDMNGNKAGVVFRNRWTGDNLKSFFQVTSSHSEDLRLSVEHSGGFVNFNNKMSMSYGHQYAIDTSATLDSRSSDVSGNGMIKSKVRGQRNTMGMTFSKNGHLQDLQFSSTGTFNKDSVSFTASWKLKSELDANIEIQTPFANFNNVGMTVFRNGNLDNLKTGAYIRYMDNKSMTGKLDLSLGGGHKIMLRSEVTTPFPGFESTVLKVDNNMDMTYEDMSGSAELTTTVDGFGNGAVRYHLARGNSRQSAEVKVMRNGRSMFDVNLSNNRESDQQHSMLSLKTMATEDLMISMDREGDLMAFTSTAKYTYGRSNIITGELNMQASQYSVKGDGKITYDLYGIGSNTMSMEIFHKGEIDDFSSEVTSKYGAQACSVKIGFKNKDDFEASMTISTPWRGYKQVGGSYKHSGSFERFNCETEVMPRDDQRYTGKLDFYRYLFRRIETTLEVATPIAGMEMMKLEYRHEGEQDSFKCFSTVEYGKSKKIVYDLSVSQYPKPEFKLSLKTPYHGYENLLATGSYFLTESNFDVSGQVKAGRGNDFSVRGSLDASRDVKGFLNINTPFEGFRDLSSTISHKGDFQKFDSEVEITFMDNQQISGKTSFYNNRWQKVVSRSELTTPFEGLENTKLSLVHEDRRNTLTSTLSLEYGRHQKMDTTVKVTYDPNYDFMVTVRTPFHQYRRLQAKGSLDITGPSYGASYSGNFGPQTAHLIDGKISFFSINNFDSSLEMKLPFSGFEQTKVEYTHKADRNSIECTGFFTLDRNQVISATLKSILSPNYATTLTVKTPYYGYETMEAYASYDTSFNKHETMGRLDLGRGQVYTVSTGLDYSVGPISAFTRISTPHSNYRQMELRVNHEGSLTSFQSTAAFTSPMISDINAGVNFRYTSLLNMDTVLTLQSPLPEADNIRVQLKTSDMGGEQKGYVELQWTDRQQMNADVAFRKQEGWYETKMITDVNIKTPFEAVSSASAQMEFVDKQGIYKEKMTLSVNQDQILNMDVQYNSDNGHQVEVTVREPWPMQFNGKAASSDDQSEAEIYVNWDRDDPESNIKLEASQADQPGEHSFSLGLIHPARSLGISHKCISTSRSISTSGKIYWNTDDASQLSYDMSLTDTSRRGRQIHLGNIKLGLPARSLKMSGSHSKSSLATAVDGTFSWDADRDMSKRVELLASLSGDEQMKGDITLRLPSFNKEMKIGGEMMFNNGHVIFDTKTDITYSPDTRKILTLTSKLEDVSYSANAFNYSFEFGMKHPYTHVDLQVLSHIGMSGERMSVGMDTQYLTARRQIKNMALFSEIDQLRNKMSLLAHNGESKLEVNGNLLSTQPYKVHLISSMDDEEAINTELTVDTDKKAIYINSQYSSDERVTLSATYPSKTIFRIDMTHHTGMNDQKELLFYMHLNTSEILYTRMPWHSELLGQLKDNSLAWAAKKSQQGQKMLKDMSDEFRDELSAKYQAITRAMAEEAEPVLVQMKQELEQVDQQLKTLIRNFDRMYSRNDLYIQRWRIMGLDFYGTVRDLLDVVAENYHMRYTRFLETLERKLQELPQVPISQLYDQWLAETGQWMEYQTEKALQDLNNLLACLDSNSIPKMRLLDSSTHYMKDLQNKLDQLAQTDLRPYLRIPDSFSNAISNTSDIVLRYVGPLMDRPELATVKGGLNEVYQQGVWAYNYWQFEESIHAHLKNLLKALSDIIEIELEEQIASKSWSKNPWVIWHPSGYVGVTFFLEHPMERLDKLPDISPYMQDMKREIDRFTPDQSILESFSKAVEYFASSSKKDKKKMRGSNDDERKMKNELKKYRPYKKVKKGRKYRTRVARQ